MIFLELKIVEKIEQTLLSRLEVNGTISFKGNKTPSNEEVLKEIAKSAGKDEKLIVLKGIKTHFGSANANFSAYIYDDEKKLKELEVKDKKAKKGAKEEEKK